MNRAVFLDRDGVLLDHSGLIISGVARQLQRLKVELGMLLIVVTNQPDIASKKMTLVSLDRINDNMRLALPMIDDLYVCPHGDIARCRCRKPKPGMLLEAAGKHAIDLGHSWMVGDRWRDVSAGNAAGCRTILLGTGYAEAMPIKPDYRAADMEWAVNIIMEAGCPSYVRFAGSRRFSITNGMMPTERQDASCSASPTRGGWKPIT